MTSSKTDCPDKTLEKSAAYIESVVIGIVHAVNSKSLDPAKDPIFSALSKQFAAIPSPPAPSRNVGLSEYLVHLRKKIEQYPDYRIKILSTDSVVDEIAGKGLVLVNEELHGIPAGVIRHAASVWRFRRDAESGLWELVSLQVEQGGFAGSAST